MLEMNMAKQDLIGQVVTIRLPEITEQTVKARVDTGAQTSAIWASDVHEDKDGLHVKFLGNNSQHVASQLIVFKDFSKAKVFSSNSLFEERYKVKLLIVVNDRKVRSWFTLTDRSQRKYPVLLGRNVLRGKFLVDITHKPTIDKTKEK